MLYINEEKIFNLLADAKNITRVKLDEILDKSFSLKRLSLEEAALLLSVRRSQDLERIFKAASIVKERIYGKRIVLFAPLYISNECSNNCAYCAFKSDNSLLKRKTLSLEEIENETRTLLKQGHKRILMVSSEAYASRGEIVDYYVSAVKAIYSTDFGSHKIKRVNVNCAPLSIEEFRKLKNSGIGTYQLFQETYHETTYRKIHPRGVRGAKSDPDNRIDAIDRAFLAGIDDVGLGVLYGLYDHKFETLALMSHIEHLEEKFNVGPHTISVPRIEPALGSDLSRTPPYRISDTEFKKIVAILRLAVPYTGIILSTREAQGLRDQLFDLGVSQISAASNTCVGGYSDTKEENGQFSVGDHRSLDEVMAALIKKGFIPSFCAACYRKDRTGKAFMNLAKPGTIKGKCSINALVTLKEYLDDFSSSEVKKEGYKLIDSLAKCFDPQERQQLSKFFEDIDKGVRDEYV